MKKAPYLTAFLSLAFSAQLMAQEAPIFPKGKVATMDNHTGTVWLTELRKSDDVFEFNLAQATFAPRAKLDWHIHPGGQILMTTEGTGTIRKKASPSSRSQRGTCKNVLRVSRIGTEQRGKYIRLHSGFAHTKSGNQMASASN